MIFPPISRSMMMRAATAYHHAVLRRVFTRLDSLPRVAALSRRCWRRAGAANAVDGLGDCSLSGGDMAELLGRAATIADYFTRRCARAIAAISRCAAPSSSGSAGMLTIQPAARLAADASPRLRFLPAGAGASAVVTQAKPPQRRRAMRPADGGSRCGRHDDLEFSLLGAVAPMLRYLNGTDFRYFAISRWLPMLAFVDYATHGHQPPRHHY